MPHIQLPNDETATIVQRNTLTERKVREISHAYMASIAVIGKLTKAGYESEDPTTWSHYSELTKEEQTSIDAYEGVLIVAMLKEWSRGELPTQESIYEVPGPTFRALKEACEAEWMSATEDFSPDGVINPKADTAASSD
jgi:hypothetical protein